MSGLADSSVLHDDDLVAVVEEADLVRDEDQRLGLAEPLEALLVDLARHLRVDGRDRVVEDEDVRVRVEGACERQPRLLPSRQRDALLADDGLVAVLEDLEVGSQAGLVHGPRVALLVVGEAEEDVVADGVGEDDGLLLDVGDAAARLELAGEKGDFPEDDAQQAALARANAASDAVEDASLEEQVDVDQRRRIEAPLPVTVETLEQNLTIL